MGKSEIMYYLETIAAIGLKVGLIIQMFGWLVDLGLATL